MTTPPGETSEVQRRVQIRAASAEEEPTTVRWPGAQAEPEGDALDEQITERPVAKQAPARSHDVVGDASRSGPGSSLGTVSQPSPERMRRWSRVLIGLAAITTATTSYLIVAAPSSPRSEPLSAPAEAARQAARSVPLVEAPAPAPAEVPQAEPAPATSPQPAPTASAEPAAQAPLVVTEEPVLRELVDLEPAAQEQADLVAPTEAEGTRDEAPLSPEAAARLLREDRSRGAAERAREVLERASQRSDPHAQVALADACVRLLDTACAQRAADRAVQLRPNRSEYLNAQRRVYRALGLPPADEGAGPAEP